MNAITTRDGTEIYYKDWGAGQPIVFSHGWPLSSDTWDDQLLFFANQGFRVIAHDRRGHGRSSQPSGGNDMDTYSDDLAQVIEALDLHDVVLVGHSTGGGEVTRYVGRHGTARVAALVIVSAIPPVMVRSASNPDGVPKEAFDDIRRGVLTDRSQYYQDLAKPFHGANRPGAAVSQGVLDQFWRLSMQCGLKSAYECITVFSETDLTRDLERVDVPMLIVHGSDDQIVPIANSALKAARIVPGAILKVYEGAPHGLPTMVTERFNADLLAFVRGISSADQDVAPLRAEPILNA